MQNMPAINKFKNANGPGPSKRRNTLTVFWLYRNKIFTNLSPGYTGHVPEHVPEDFHDGCLGDVLKYGVFSL